MIERKVYDPTWNFMDPVNFIEGSMDWALAKARTNKAKVRRPHWPTREQDDQINYWHLWVIDPPSWGGPWDPQYIVGWGGQIGADHSEGDFKFEGQYDGTNYFFSEDDVNIRDWVITPVTETKPIPLIEDKTS